MKVAKYMGCLCLAASSSFSFAIVPVDKFNRPPQGFSGTIGFALEGEAGNRSEQEYNVNGIVRHGWASRSLTWNNDYNYTKTNGERNEEDFFTHLRFVEHNYFGDDIGLESFVQYEYDDFSDLSSRKLAGGGVRWHFNDEAQDTSFKTVYGTGAFYEIEKSESTSLSSETVRGNFYGRLLYEDEGDSPLSVYFTLYVQPSLEQLDDIRALMVVGLEFPITESLSFAIEAEANHDTDPFPGVDKTDVDYGVRASYSF